MSVLFSIWVFPADFPWSLNPLGGRNQRGYVVIVFWECCSILIPAEGPVTSLRSRGLVSTGSRGMGRFLLIFRKATTFPLVIMAATKGRFGYGFTSIPLC
ncbi:hypothetical protein AVEN_7950-1 [Araneus ventricosus]|uniref:Uncharacterized protein n=1 Tax=Araneus ventricosus TaxID=182803 RepID=A0A4Y2D1T3_ARAVE|nr:hypothetical protein AVEN_7950-1 [Araneus ventricosus]